MKYMKYIRSYTCYAHFKHVAMVMYIMYIRTYGCVANAMYTHTYLCWVILTDNRQLWNFPFSNYHCTLYPKHCCCRSPHDHGCLFRLATWCPPEHMMFQCTVLQHIGCFGRFLCCRWLQDNLPVLSQYQHSWNFWSEFVIFDLNPQFRNINFEKLHLKQNSLKCCKDKIKSCSVDLLELGIPSCKQTTLASSLSQLA